MRFLSVCSGIEAASVAWNPLGWQAVAFSEIEPFPCAVLAHHYPDVPNWGDMTKYKEWPDADVDLLCGGTPCQSFSVAGLRKGLDDPRGNLMLTFGAIAGRYRPRWLVWENVPGVLSSNGGQDFASFLGLITGQVVKVPTGGWNNSGIASGIRDAYGAAYRVLDAQYFGVAQRRRRVFVVGYLGDWRRAAAVLFERHSLSGHPAPSREAGEEIAGTFKACAGKSGGWSNSVDHAAAGYMVPVAYSIQAGATRTNPNSGPDGVGVQRDRAYTLEARSEVQCVAFNSRQTPVTGDCFGTIGTSSPQAQAVCIHADAIGRTGEAVTPSADAEGRIRLRNPGLGVIDDGTSYNLMATGQPHAVCVTGDITHTLRAEGFDASEDGTGRGQPIVFSVSLRGRDGGATAELGDEVGNCLRASSGGGDKPYVLAIALQTDVTPKASEELAFTLKLPSASGGGQPAACMTPQMAVRRLTPRECERLQGFPDDYTLTPYRGKPAADGNRYKSLGNSMAVPVMRWIGERIEQVESLEAA